MFWHSYKAREKAFFDDPAWGDQAPKILAVPLRDEPWHMRIVWRMAFATGREIIIAGAAVGITANAVIWWLVQ